MPRPDPQRIQRQPMAHARSNIAWSKTPNNRVQQNPLFSGRAVNIETLDQILERAETITEGRIDSLNGSDRLFGSTLISCRIRMDDLAELDAEITPGDIVSALEGDQRVRRLIDDRIFRELAKLLGEQTSVDFEAQTKIAFVGNTLTWTVDFESAIDGRAATAG
ncbi:MAG: hypothetical protein VYA30_14190 [Myxococcota bacterium]|nr:hypothetical protein [Myxococcota bacterium]